MFKIFKSLFSKKPTSTATTPTVKQKYSEYVKAETPLEVTTTPTEFTPAQLEFFNRFEDYLELDPLFNLNQFKLQVTNHLQLSNQEFTKVLLPLCKKFDDYSIRSLPNTDADKYFPMELISTIEHNYKQSILDQVNKPRDKRSPNGLYLLCYFMQNLYQDFQSLHLQQPDKFINFFEYLSYYQLYDQATLVAKLAEVLEVNSDKQLKQLINSQFHAEHPANPFMDKLLHVDYLKHFSKRLPLLLAAEVAKKATFLPLSYHDVYKSFLADDFDNQPLYKEIVKVRRKIISHGNQTIQLLLTNYLFRTFIIHNYTNTANYAVDVRSFNAVTNDLQSQVNLLFIDLLLMRRKTHSSAIMLFEKDIELVNQECIWFGLNRDYKNLYLYLKHLGL